MTAVLESAVDFLVVFDGETLARGWRSVALAMSSDEESPALYRSMQIELYDDGMWLVAADGFVLLRSWVPAEGYDGDPPGLDEAPVATAVARDVHQRVLAFMKYVAKLTKGDDALPVSVDVLIHEPTPLVGEPMAFEGMERRQMTVSLGQREKLWLDCFDGEFPDWRSLTSGFVAATTDRVGMNAEVVGRLAQLGALNGNGVLVWHFGGEEKMARLEIRGSEPKIDGVVMPVRLSYAEMREGA